MRTRYEYEARGLLCCVNACGGYGPWESTTASTLRRMGRYRRERLEVRRREVGEWRKVSE